MMLLVALAYASPVSDALAARDGGSCAALGEATPALRDELVALTDPATLPPTVPVRAASCLVERFGTEPSVQELVAGWTVDAERQGLAMAALLVVDQLGEPGAMRVVQAALASPLARVSQKAREVGPASSFPSVRALVTP
jgi:hypothetical protein